MVKLVTVFECQFKPMMTVSYGGVLLEHLVMKYKSKGQVHCLVRRTGSRFHNITPLIFFSFPIGLLEMPSKNISHPSLGATTIISSSRRSVASVNRLGQSELLGSRQELLPLSSSVEYILCRTVEVGLHFVNLQLKVGRLRMFLRWYAVETSLMRWCCR